MTVLFLVPAFVLVAVLVYLARYSGRLRVEEKRLIAAPVGVVYAHVADFRAWREWAQWLEHEPGAPIDLRADPAGVGGIYAWHGARIGAGAIEHERLVALQRIEQRIDVQQPFRFRGRSAWTFAAHGDGTEVGWAFSGRVGFTLRAFAPTVRSAIALDHRYALDRLARLVEPAAGAHARAHYSLAYLGVRDVLPCHYVWRGYEGALAGLGPALRAGFAALRAELAASGLDAAGEPIAVYLKTNIKMRSTVCRIGIPVAEPLPGSLPTRALRARRAYVVRLAGSHAALEIAWYQAMQRVRIEGLQADQRLEPFERYLNDPDHVAENECLVDLHIPLLAAAP